MKEIIDTETLSTWTPYERQIALHRLETLVMFFNSEMEVFTEWDADPIGIKRDIMLGYFRTRISDLEQAMKEIKEY